MFSSNINMNHKQLFFAVILLFVSLHGEVNLHAQPTTEWTRAYHGFGIGEAYSTVQTSDGGYVLTGIDGFGKYPKDTLRLRVTKVDAGGTTEWTKTYGGSHEREDGGSSIIQTSDRGFFVVGFTEATDGDVTFNHGLQDIWVLKLSAIGAIEWQKTYGGSMNEDAFSLAQSRDKGYFIAGMAYSKDGDVAGNTKQAPIWILKIDSVGSLQWQHCFGNGYEDFLGAIAGTSDGGVAIGGEAVGNDGDVSGYHACRYNGCRDAWVLKLDSAGNLLWENCYGGSGDENAKAIIESADGGLVAAGYTTSNDGDVTGNTDTRNGSLWVFKLDSRGALQWQNSLGGTNSEGATSIVETVDRGFAIAGSTNSNDGDVSGNHGGADLWVVKLDSLGRKLWQKCVGGSGIDYAHSIIQTTDLGFALAGGTTSADGDVVGLTSLDTRDFWLVKLSGTPCNDIRVALPGGKLQAQAGDTVRIPIVCFDSSVRPLSVLDLCLKLNTDLLSPIGIDPTVGVFAGVQPRRFLIAPDSVSIQLALPNAIRIAPGTLCDVVCIANVALATTTNIRMPRIAFADPPFNSSCLTAVAAAGVDSSIAFSIVSECGDATMMSKLSNGLDLTVGPISPNPASQKLSVIVKSRSKSQLEWSVMDVLGRVVLHEVRTTTGAAEALQLNVSTLAEGSYVLRVALSGQSAAASQRLIVRRK
jgi:hypothetical protein